MALYDCRGRHAGDVPAEEFRRRQRAARRQSPSRDVAVERVRGQGRLGAAVRGHQRPVGARGETDRPAGARSRDPRFDTTTKRVANAAEVDATIAPWIAQLTVAECVDKLNAISISTGPILRVADLARRAEPRPSRHGPHAAPTGETRVPGSPLRGSVGTRRDADEHCPDARRRGSRTGAAPLAASRLVARARRSPRRDRRKPPLAGVRVIEMGQFTTAPLVGRQLGALGADVIKLEPERRRARARDAAAQERPGLLLLAVELRHARDDGRSARSRPRRAAHQADREGRRAGREHQARHAGAPRFHARAHPRRSIRGSSIARSAGFGFDAPSAGLGAMDTTIQGLAGIMDLTRVDGVPYKTGISIADLHAGQFALFATLAALEYRDRTGKGQVIDLAMLDAASWVTRTTWNDEPTRAADVSALSLPATATSWSRSAAARPTSRRDGTVPIARIASSGGEATDRKASSHALDEIGDRGCAGAVGRARCWPHPQTSERGLIFEAKARDGSTWNLLKCPISLSRHAGRGAARARSARCRPRRDPARLGDRLEARAS